SLSFKNMTSKEQSWLDFINSLPVKPIKEETFDSETIELSPSSTENIDYTIIDQQFDIEDSKEFCLIETNTSKVGDKKIKNPRKKAVTKKCKLNFLFFI
ncbi:unnamed protein product, partial [Adineta steineri]